MNRCNIETARICPRSFCVTSTQQRGLSLIEIMYVLVIAAILAAVAIPSYQDYVKRGRRSDAVIALERVANEQEQFYFDHHRYTSSFNSLNIPDVSPDGFYNLTITQVEAAYVATATPDAGGSQQGDGSFRRTSAGEQSWDPGQDGDFECSWQDAFRSGRRC